MFFGACLLFSQEAKNIFIHPDSTLINFRDTSYSFVTDSLSHDFGNIPHLPDKLVKYFKYTGNDSVRIVRAWTGDPHYICK